MFKQFEYKVQDVIQAQNLRNLGPNQNKVVGATIASVNQEQPSLKDVVNACKMLTKTEIAGAVRESVAMCRTDESCGQVCPRPEDMQELIRLLHDVSLEDYILLADYAIVAAETYLVECNQPALPVLNICKSMIKKLKSKCPKCDDCCEACPECPSKAGQMVMTGAVGVLLGLGIMQLMKK